MDSVAAGALQARDMTINKQTIMARTEEMEEDIAQTLHLLSQETIIDL